MLEQNPFAAPAADVTEHGVRPADTPEVDFTLTRREFVLFQLHHAARMPLMHVIILVCAGCIAIAQPKVADAVGAFVVILLVMWIVQLASVALFAGFGRNHRLFTRHAIRLSDEALDVRNSHAHCRYHWAGIEKVCDYAGVLAIYVNKQAAHLIPPRAFEDPNHRMLFVSVLNARRAAADQQASFLTVSDLRQR